MSIHTINGNGSTLINDDCCYWRAMLSVLSLSVYLNLTVCGNGEIIPAFACKLSAIIAVDVGSSQRKTHGDRSTTTRMCRSRRSTDVLYCSNIDSFSLMLVGTSARHHLHLHANVVDTRHECRIISIHAYSIRTQSQRDGRVGWWWKIYYFLNTVTSFKPTI